MTTTASPPVLDPSGEGPDSMVALIDVLFSVLAGVMLCLTVSVYGGKIPIELPGTAAPGSGSTVATRVVFDAEGRIFLRDEEVALEQLPAALRAALPTPDAAVVVHGDARASFGVSTAVLQAVRDAGVTSVSLATSKRRSPAR